MTEPSVIVALGRIHVTTEHRSVDVAAARLWAEQLDDGAAQHDAAAVRDRHLADRLRAAVRQIEAEEVPW